jgi:hypothetical protein
MATGLRKLRNLWVPHGGGVKVKRADDHRVAVSVRAGYVPVVTTLARRESRGKTEVSISVVLPPPYTAYAAPQTKPIDSNRESAVFA